jgi:hypothetical protein
VERMFGNFLDLREKVFFFLSTMPEGYLPPRVEFSLNTNFLYDMLLGMKVEVISIHQ